MTAGTLPGDRQVGANRPQTADGAGAARAFLVAYGTTLVPLLTGLLALELGWAGLEGNTWPGAVAAVTGWSMAAAAWLHRRHWPSGIVGAVNCAPLALLAGPMGLGWVSPAGLVLWGPITTLLAVAWMLAVLPLGSADVRPAGEVVGDGPVLRHLVDA